MVNTHMLPGAGDDGRIQVTRDPRVKSMDEALREAFAMLGLPVLGGASGRGWSSWEKAQRCLYLYKHTIVDGVRGEPSAALETGAAYHAFVAVHREALIDTGAPVEMATSEQLRDALLHVGASTAAVMEAWRLHESYVSRYEVDYLVPLAVEYLAATPDGTFTCRFDEIAHVPEAAPGVLPGTWIVERKTTARFDSSSTAWANDGEVLGQIMVYQAVKRDEQGFGPLQGVIVDLVSKTKTPDFMRVIVPAQAWQIEAHAADLKFWRAQVGLCEALNVWPRSRAGCIGRYGKCALYDHCATEGR
jgi:hypothetical protein